MNSYLYYRRGEEWVRVNADDYSREYENDPGAYEGGQCEDVAYYVYADLQIYRDGNPTGFVRTVRSSSMRGPTGSVFVNETGKQAFVNSPFGPIGMFQTLRTADLTYRAISNVRVEARNGAEDNCGNRPTEGSCTTVFTLNGEVTLILPDCPDVRSRDECAECCGELLAIARQISV